MTNDELQHEKLERNTAFNKNYYDEYDQIKKEEYERNANFTKLMAET